jgi:hypothetical protein
MEIEVRRFETSADGRATIGRWYTNDMYRSYTLEDKIREIIGQPVEKWKIAGETAIPVGRYPAVVDQSARFSLRTSQRFGRPIQVWTIRLVNVPGYTGIRVHGGSRALDTEGCVLPGLTHPARVNFIGGSRAALDIIQPEVEMVVGLRRVPGPPECWSAGLPPKTVWHYEQVETVEDVWITIMNGFPVAMDPALTAE